MRPHEFHAKATYIGFAAMALTWQTLNFA